MHANDDNEQGEDVQLTSIDHSCIGIDLAFFINEILEIFDQ